MAILETEAILNTAGTLIVVFNRQGNIQRFNHTCEKVTGYLESEVKGHPAWAFLLVPEERLAMQGIFTRLIGGQTNTYSQNTWLDKTGSKHIIAWSNTVLTDGQGHVDFVIASGIEVTEQHRSQRQLEGQYRQSHLLAEITREVAHSLELETILETTVSEVQGLLGCDRVLILQAPPQGPITLAAESIANCQPIQSSHLSEAFESLLNPVYVEHYQRQSVSVIDTVSGLGTAPAIVSILNQLGVKSELVVPVLTQTQAHGRGAGMRGHDSTRHGELWGLLIAHQCSQARRWSPLEIDLMQQLANQIGVAITHAELLDHLEEMVDERTAELRETNQQLRREMRDRAQAQLDLRRSENQLRLVTNALPALVAYIDKYHRYRFNNYAYESWYGIPYKQITGKQVNDIVDPKVYQQMLPHLEKALAGEKVTYELEMIQGDGQRLWASVSYIPDMQGNRIQGLFSLVSDISDRKAAERMKDDFVSVVSHELRTPLTSIHGSLKLLATGQLGDLSQQGDDLIEIALNNTERLTRLINDVLDLERMGSGRVSMVPVNCNAAELVNHAVKAMQSMADEYNVHLAVEAEPIMVLADSDHIMQALTNLLSNAIKFSPQGKTVTIKARMAHSKAANNHPANHPSGQSSSQTASSHNSNNVEFLVRDMGRGIPGDKLESIFERFQQVDSSDARERGGTGLGLAICREIVQQHQGRIWVQSIDGQGSTFHFTLPLGQSSKHASESSSEGMSESSAESSVSQKAPPASYSASPQAISQMPLSMTYDNA